MWISIVLYRSHTSEVLTYDPFYKGSHNCICHQTWAIPVFSPQPHNITGHWLVVIVLTHWEMVMLRWPVWLVTCRTQSWKWIR